MGSHNKMENIAGKYKFDKQENFDEFLKAQGIGMIKRKAVASFKPETTITVNGHKFTFENTTPLKTTRKTEFTLDEAFEVDLMGNGEKDLHQLFIRKCSDYKRHAIWESCSYQNIQRRWIFYEDDWA